MEVMTPPDAEWMLWAKRLNDQHRALQARVAELERLYTAPRLEVSHDEASQNQEPEPTGELASDPLADSCPLRSLLEDTSESTSQLTREIANRRPSTATTRAETVLAVEETQSRLDDMAQGQRTLLEYFDEVILEHRRREHELVRMFLNGMNSPYRREALEIALGDNHDWTFEKLGKEIRKLQEDAEKRKTRRRRQTSGNV